MPRTRSVAWAELKLGVVGIVAILLVTTLVVAVGGAGGFPWQRYPLKTLLPNAGGLKTGAVVRLSGKEIGTVTSVEFAGAQLEVVMEISKTVRSLVTSESAASIGSLSLLGEPMIDIRASTSGTPLDDWGYLRASGGGGLDDLTTTASESLEEAGKVLADVRSGRGTVGQLFTDEALYRELTQFVTAAADVAESIKKGQGTLGALTKDPAAYQSLKAAVDNLQTMTAKINSGQGPLARFLNDESMGRSFANTATNLEQVTARLGRGEGTLGKLLTDQQLFDRLTAMTTRVERLVAGLEEGRGTAGQLLRDQRLYDNMNRAVTELRDLFADVRKDPKKYLRLSVSIF